MLQALGDKVTLVDRSKITWPKFLTWEGWDDIHSSAISEASEYSGQKALNINIPDSSSGYKRKKVIGEWCEFIPSLKGIESVALQGTTTQELFDAICTLNTIQDIRITSASRTLSNINAISNVSSLQRAFLDSFGSVTSLEPFSELDKLEWLELIDFTKVTSLQGLDKLKMLKGLILASRDRSKLINLDNYDAIATMESLRYLDLCGTRVEKGNLDCLTNLNGLKYMDIPLIFPAKEIAKVVYSLPLCDHGLGPYREINGWGPECKKCGGDNLVAPISKGSRNLCKNCDSNKILLLEHEFKLLLEATPNKQSKADA